MGKGGKHHHHQAATKAGKQEESSSEWQSPFTPQVVDPKVSGKTKDEINAQFPTKSQLRAVIPPHCFQRSTLRSLWCVLCDILQGVAVWYITYNVVGLSVDPPEGGNNPLAWLVWRLAWNVYGIVMGFAIGGLWVLGHECGHGAFSEYPWLNGLVGWILHSIMLVPYYSWAFSHAKHHRNTNHLIHGETHVPATYNEVGLKLKNDNDQLGPDNYERLSKEVVDSKLSLAKEGFSYPLYGHALAHEHYGDEGFAGVMAWSRLFLGWQMYLFGVSSTGKIGADRQPIPKGTFPDHFRPSSRLFPAKLYWKVVWSDIGLLLVVSALAYFSWKYSFRAVWFWYFGPYFLVHAFLVTVTWLQHTHESVPHFDLEEWSWMKASLAGTIDRPLYGWMNHVSHNIVTTHIVHHLFHEIPHYHAVEATKHVRAYLEPKGLYNYDPTDAMVALWKVCKTCHFVDTVTGGVQYYRSLQDVAKTSERKNPPTKKLN